VTDDRQRLVLYELLARTRRTRGDREGADRAVAAAVALLREEVRSGHGLAGLTDLTRFCLETEDAGAVGELLAVAGEATKQLSPGERALWLAWAAGVAERNGDYPAAARSREEARRLLPQRL